MEEIISPQVLEGLVSFINISKQDPKAEVECKLLSDRIKTKDVADRLLKAIDSLCSGQPTEENRLTISYGDTRVNVMTPQLIHKVCITNSFREIPLTVEKKSRYVEGKNDTIDVADADIRFTVRTETPLRKDWEGSPSDVNAFIRIIHRKSFITTDKLFRFDFSMVKFRNKNSNKLVRDILKQPHFYELEIEFIGKKSKLESGRIAVEFLNKIHTILQAFHQTEFLLSNSDITRYVQEFRMTNNTFYDLVTLLRRHVNIESPNNISKDYTVTNKADGDRSGLYVARDRKVLKINKQEQIVWTGLVANNDNHLGDFIDGEYIPDKNLFCIFDVYRFRNRDTKSLPLMKTDEDMTKNPLASRLGCAHLFVTDLQTEFTMKPSMHPLRVETKLFLAGDGVAMEEAIHTMLNTKFEYEIDGLIFTPRSTGVAPANERRGKTWKTVYKWKPSTQNSIDFLLKFVPGEAIDSVTKEVVKQGELFVSRGAGDNLIYPREMMNEEYVPKRLPEDLDKIAATNSYIPSFFQPDSPRDPDAYKILLPLNKKNIPVDIHGEKVEDNTIIECAYNMETNQWVILRTRYDKTYSYRVQQKPVYGNDFKTANSVWTSMHVPITERMISTFMSEPIDTSVEDDAYYRDELKRENRVFKDVYTFHNRIKDQLYVTNVQKDETIMELACGRGGDMHKLKKAHPSKVVGVDISLTNITSTAQGAATRYLRDKQDNPHDYMPPILYLVGDMTQFPLLEQEDKYMPILLGTEKGTTSYLAQFENLNLFDKISCQFAFHYACESELVFRNFAKNIEKYCKDGFFGTCSDGKAIYSLLLGKKTHYFGGPKNIAGEYTKEYQDRESWTEEFGMPVKVSLESFDKPAVEYLVPFEKVVDIMKEYGFDLVESKMFSEIYSAQTKLTLTKEQQTFSFLNRSFVFKRNTAVKEPEPIKEPEPEQESVKVVETPAKKTRKLKKEKEPEPEPVLFFGSDESKGEHRSLSNMSEHPIEVDGVKFPTVEHYFQAMKAKLFADEEMYEKILKAKTPKAAKALGKKVQNLIPEKWDAEKDMIMEKGLRAKFVQHPELRKQLLETGDKVIGEANPRDGYWGIGSGRESDKSRTPSKWRGKNMLGKLIMKLREVFKTESS
jgi:hypothetical protein